MHDHICAIIINGSVHIPVLCGVLPRTVSITAQISSFILPAVAFLLLQKHTSVNGDLYGFFLLPFA